MSESYAQRLRRWREGRGILQFINEELKVSPDPWQEEAALAFADPDPSRRRISLQACAGPGKSAVLAWCGWWFLGVQGERGEHPKGAAFSITGDNLKSNLWAEFSKWQARSTYLSTAFTWTASGIFANDHPATWRIDPKAWPKTANADEQGKTLSGLHSKYVLVLGDETGAIPMTVLRAGEQALSNCSFGKIMQAGNPISLDGMLYAAATEQRHLWVVIRITGDPDDPKRSSRIDIGWARQQIEMYGRDNPWVKSYILGQFPDASINALLGVEEVEAAMNRHLSIDRYEWAQKRLGVDVARFGDDRTVIFPRQGAAAFRPVVMRVQNTVQIAARVARAAIEWGRDGLDVELILVDDTGHWGHGVIDNLTTAGYPAIGIVSSDRALDPRYKNRRAEKWIAMAEWVRSGGALPPVRELVAELTVPTYSFVAGKFILEDKDQIKARLGRSPDLADALSETFALPDQPAQMIAKLRGRNKVRTEFDPFAFEPSGEGVVIIEHDPFEEVER